MRILMRMRVVPRKVSLSSPVQGRGAFCLSAGPEKERRIDLKKLHVSSFAPSVLHVPGGGPPPRGGGLRPGGRGRTARYPGPVGPEQRQPLCLFAYPHVRTDPWARDFIREHFSVTVTTNCGPCGLYGLNRYSVFMGTPAGQFLPS